MKKQEIATNNSANSWSIEQTKKLFALVHEAHDEEKGLVWAFSKMSEESNRSVNSVRNYYYSQLKMFELIPNLASDLGIRLISNKRGEFELFSESEIKNLVQTILINKAKGKSVRATIAELSKGDSKLALRLQNKYRSMVTHHKGRVTQMMNELSSRGVVFFNPYTKEVMTKDTKASNHSRLADYISSLDDGQVDEFFDLMKRVFA
ncbi:MAG: hypothetical protein FWC11_06830 [Firmicutes bacterium]|nr:hypothetical protein [Bacillota bacterium]MCL2256540.1 hypothetical protein [Bacillota bacterium]